MAEGDLQDIDKLLVEALTNRDFVGVNEALLAIEDAHEQTAGVLPENVFRDLILHSFFARQDRKAPEVKASRPWAMTSSTRRVMTRRISSCVVRLRSRFG